MRVFVRSRRRRTLDCSGNARLWARFEGATAAFCGASSATPPPLEASAASLVGDDAASRRRRQRRRRLRQGCAAPPTRPNLRPPSFATLVFDMRALVFISATLATIFWRSFSFILKCHRSSCLFIVTASVFALRKRTAIAAFKAPRLANRIKVAKVSAKVGRRFRKEDFGLRPRFSALLRSAYSGRH